jgi:uroporphyrinogen-III synthase
MTSGALSGRGIVITRPREHAVTLADLIRAAGGDPVLFPTLEILPPDDPAALAGVIARLSSFQLAVFVSPTAAARGCAMVRASAWPAGLRIAAVGAGTAKTLERLGYRDVISPLGEADSEALAALPELQNLRDCMVVIFRGQGGREWLRARLEAQGARVEYAECYRRARPASDAGGLLARWQRGGIDAVSITSVEGLKNFIAMLGPTGKGYLCATPMFVPHPRIAATARELGVRCVLVSGSGDDQAVSEMSAFFSRV